jgi:transcriptional regulator with XRE-family HTH domain
MERPPPLAATTDAPLPEALDALLRRRGIGVASLASLLRAEGLTIGRTRLNELSRGEGRQPTPEQLERLAAVLGVSPAFFAEYRLWRARSLLDPGVVGFDRAMVNFARLRGARAPRDAEATVSETGRSDVLAG